MASRDVMSEQAHVAPHGFLASDMMEVARLLTDENEDNRNVTTLCPITPTFKTIDELYCCSTSTALRSFSSQCSIVAPVESSQCSSSDNNRSDDDDSSDALIPSKRSRDFGWEGGVGFDSLGPSGDSIEGDAKCTRIRRRRTAPFIRVLKRDFRRDLPRMFVNTINGGCPILLANFFKRFCVEDCQNLDIFKLSLLPEKISINQLCGAASIVDFIYSQVSVMPDLICELLESKIVRKQAQAGCQVVMKTHFKGTNLAESVVTVVDSDDREHNMPRWVFDFLPSISTHRIKGYSMSTRPFTLDIIGATTLYLDDSHQVYRVEFDGVWLTQSLSGVSSLRAT